MASSPPAIAVTPTPSAKAMRCALVDVDAHVGRGLRIVGRRAQRLAEPRAADQHSQRHDGRNRDEPAMPRDLLTKTETRSPHSGPISQALAGQRRAHRDEDRAEGNQAPALHDQRDAERQDELGVMALALDLGARAADTADQRLMDDVADAEQHRPGQQRGDVWADRSIRATACTPKAVKM